MCANLCVSRLSDAYVYVHILCRLLLWYTRIVIVFTMQIAHSAHESRTRTGSICNNTFGTKHIKPLCLPNALYLFAYVCAKRWLTLLSGNICTFMYMYV